MSSCLEAAISILRDAGKPLHYQEITDKIIKSGLWYTSSKDPAATVRARLIEAIQGEGLSAAIKRIEPGLYEFVTNGNSDPPAEQENSNSKSTKYSFVNAAEKVLQEKASGQPLHYRVITEVALHQEWIKTRGKTPWLTMYTSIIQEEKSRLKRGIPLRFNRLGGGMFALSENKPDGIHLQLESTNHKIRKQLLNEILETPPADFEELVSRLLVAIGFQNVEVTKYSGDGGVDVRGQLLVAGSVKIQMAVQAKRYQEKDNIGPSVVRELRGSLQPNEQGMIITTSGFTKSAREEASRENASPIALMNGEQLVQSLFEYEIGVQRESIELFTMGEGEHALIWKEDEEQQD